MAFGISRRLRFFLTGSFGAAAAPSFAASTGLSAASGAVFSVLTLRFLLLHDFKLLAHGLRLAGALAGASVGVGALAANRKAFAMAQAAVRAKIHQALDIHSDDAAQFPFHIDRFIDLVADFAQIFFRHHIGFDVE